jgi:hypothetical protein
MKANHRATLKRLVDMGYLKYVPSPELEAVKQQLLSSMNYGIIESDWGTNCVASDRRGYPADNEELAEGRIGESLHLMKEVLAQEGVRLESVEDDFGEYHYDILVNGERYKIYDRAGENVWSVALKRFLEVVNEFLQRAGSKERLFGIYGGNDGRAILLTEEMHQYLGCLPWIDRRWMPYTTEAIEVGDRK